MKKSLIVLLALALILCAGCTKQDPVQTETPTTAPVQTEAPTTVPVEETVPPTTEETIPVPELSTAYAMVDQTPAILDTLLRDDVVEVNGTTGCMSKEMVSQTRIPTGDGGGEWTPPAM